MSDPGVFRRLEPGVTYRLCKHHGELRYALPNLVDVRQTRWAWRAPVHEYLQRLEGPQKEITLDQAWILYHSGEGVRSRGLSQQEKFLRDAALLETALREDPRDARNRFYLAQSYRDAGEPAKALRHYALRVDMGGWEEEVYVAQCERAKLAIQLGHVESEILAQHLRAWSLRPSRAEALWQLASYYRERQRYAEGYLYAKVGKDIPLPADILFLQRDVYEWRLLDEFAVCAYWIGQYRESAEASERLLREGLYPSEHGPRLQKNLDFARAKRAAG